MVGRTLAAVLLACAVSATLTAADARSRLLGSWRLVDYVVIDAAGRKQPGNFDTGSIVYDASGQMSAHLMRARGRASGNPTTDADRSAAYRSYLGYFGPFTVDERRGVVVHTVTGSSFPHWVGTDQVRYFSLSNDGRTLELSLKDGDRVTQTLTWKKVD